MTNIRADPVFPVRRVFSLPGGSRQQTVPRPPARVAGVVISDQVDWPSRSVGAKETLIQKVSSSIVVIANTPADEGTLSPAFDMLRVQIIGWDVRIWRGGQIFNWPQIWLTLSTFNGSVSESDNRSLTKIRGLIRMDSVVIVIPSNVWSLKLCSSLCVDNTSTWYNLNFIKRNMATKSSQHLTFETDHVAVAS